MNKRNTLKWQMLRLIGIGWFVPLTAIVLIFFLVVAGRIDAQSRRTITTSMEKAAEICILRLSDCIEASKDASYLPTIRDAYSDYKKTGDEGRLYNEVTVFLSENYKYDDSFDMSVLFFTEDPDTLYYTGNAAGKSSISLLRYFRDEVLLDVVEISKNLDTRTEFFCSGSHVYMIRNMMNRSFEPYAVLVMELDPKEVFGSLRSVWAYEGMSVFYDGSLLVADGKTSATGPTDAPVYDRIILRKNNGENEAICFDKSVDGTFTYVVSYDASAVDFEKRFITITFLFFILFLVPLLYVVLKFFEVRINTPITNLTEASKQIAEGNYGVKAPPLPPSSGEIADLTGNFNRMSEKLSEQFNKIFVEEIALRDANIHALQSQINPHFLNNTLEIINWEARMNGEEKVSSMIEALSVMMSATMDRNRQSLITLKEELDYVHAYIYIIECRYQDRFSFSEEVDPLLMSVYVPRLIIQPVIENAVEYSRSDDGRRNISMKIEGKTDGKKVDMKIIITNPGEPTDEDLKKISILLSDDGDIKHMKERSTGIGIRNVHRRLKMIYGKESDLTIEPDGQGNTISTIFVKN